MKFENNFIPQIKEKSVVRAVTGLFGGGGDDAKKQAAVARKQAEEQKKLLAEQQRQADLEADRLRQERLSGARARRAGTIGRRSLIATSELGVQDTLG